MRSAFCGWFGTPVASDDVAGLMAPMASQLGAETPTTTAVNLASPQFALATSNLKAKHAASAGPLHGVLMGRPRWRDADLRSLQASEGPGRALLAAYKRFQVDLLEQLFGDFTLLVVDTEANHLMLAIDRIGKGTLNYSQIPGGGIVFATNAVAVNAHPKIRAEVDPQSIYDYLFFHMVPSPRTIFAGQYKLQPGEVVEFGVAGLQRRLYWQPTFKTNRSSSETALAKDLHRHLNSAVSSCLETDTAPAGAFLSGGVDSSTIAGLMAAQQPTPPSTYSIGFDVEAYDEMRYARIAAKHFGTKQHEYYLSPQDVVDILPRIARAYDEPFGNSSAVPSYYCAKLARENGTTIMLAGDGGDELFGGNVRYSTQQLFERYFKLPKPLRTGLIEPILQHLGPLGKIPPLRKAQRYVDLANIPLPDRLENYNYFTMTGAENILNHDLLSELDVDGPMKLLRASYSRSSGSSILNRMLALDWKQTLADNDLRKVDRMAELAGIDVRYPFLDDDLIAFSETIPAELKIKRFKLRYFFKRAMRSFLPPEVLTKSKHGFGLPFGVWTRTFEPLRELAYDSLSDLSKRNIVQPQYIESLLHLHKTEHASYYGEFIWVLMMLELWFREHQL